jgi:hypothetical protein
MYGYPLEVNTYLKVISQMDFCYTGLKAHNTKYLALIMLTIILLHLFKIVFAMLSYTPLFKIIVSGNIYLISYFRPHF